MSESPYLTTKQLADRLHLAVQTIYNRQLKGWSLRPAIIDGRRPLYALADVEEYERRQRAA